MTTLEREPYTRPAPSCPECGGPPDTGAGHDCEAPAEQLAPTRPTYRERRLARADRLEAWSEKRAARSTAAFDKAHAIADGIPLGQPILVGHHSEGRARRDAERIRAGMSAGIENQRKAARMSSSAEEIRRQADRAIYSDDPDAPERLRAKLEELEAERARIREFNVAVRKAKCVTAEALAILDERQRDQLASVARVASYQLGPHGAFPSYAATNLSGRISALRGRLSALEGPRPAPTFRPDRRGVCRRCGEPEELHADPGAGALKRCP